MIIPIIFALISYIGWGVGDIFGTIASRKTNAYVTAFSKLVLGLTIFSFYIPFAKADFDNISLNILVLLAILSLIGYAGLVSFYQGLKQGNASVVGTIAASFTSVVVLLSVVFLKDVLSVKQLISILVIFTGVLLTSLENKKFIISDFISGKGVVYAFVAMISWGIYFTFIKLAVNKIGWFWPAYITSAFAILYTAIYLKVKKIKIDYKAARKSALPIILNAALLATAEMSYNFAISKGQTSLVAPIAGAYPTLFVVLAFIVFKDAIKRHQISGIIMTLIGIVLLSIFSV